MVGQDLPLAGNFISAGEILVDVFIGNILLYSVLASSGGTDAFSFPVPDDSALIGLVAFTQGVVLGGDGPALGNAVDLVVGP